MAVIKETRTMREDYREAVRKIRLMSCEELYKLIDEMRMVRDRVEHLLTHFLLTGYIHIASGELRRRCPELFEKLAAKWREAERWK